MATTGKSSLVSQSVSLSLFKMAEHPLLAAPPAVTPAVNQMNSRSLSFSVESVCSRTRARCGLIRFRDTSHADKELPDAVETPVFMPVGTSASLKGLLPEQLEATGCRLMLSNTYHLALRPGVRTIQKAGGVQNFMRWPHALLTDSGGFQMVSLSKLMNVTEEGVTFESPYSQNEVLHLPPEQSIRVQQVLKSNIMMQLDDVVSATANDEVRFREAADRSIRWLDRCMTEHGLQEQVQSLFPIIQGGLNADLRKESQRQIVQRDTSGIAIGGLSGGEEKEKFIEMVAVSTDGLPEGKPRYLMGVGFAMDLILCSALGCDMFDCVYPSRTARFGTALIGWGRLLKLKNACNATDVRVLDPECDCSTCSHMYSRAYIHTLLRAGSPVACHLLTVHNMRFQMRFMSLIRQSIRDDSFVPFIQKTLDFHFSSPDKYPPFVNKFLQILNLKL